MDFDAVRSRFSWNVVYNGLGVLVLYINVKFPLIITALFISFLTEIPGEIYAGFIDVHLSLIVSKLFLYV